MSGVEIIYQVLSKSVYDSLAYRKGLSVESIISIYLILL